MPEINAIDLLRGVFDVVLRRAESDPVFALQLIEAIPGGARIIVPAKKGGSRKAESAQGNVIDVNDIHPVVLMRENKEDFLRSKLQELSSDKLKLLVTIHQFQIVGKSKLKKSPLIDAIIDAARHRIANLDAQAA